jgi:hypothetical protein
MRILLPRSGLLLSGNIELVYVNSMMARKWMHPWMWVQTFGGQWANFLLEETSFVLMQILQGSLLKTVCQ